MKRRLLLLLLLSLFFCLATKRLLVPLDLHNAQTVVKTDGAFHAKVESQDRYVYICIPGTLRTLNSHFLLVV